MATDSASETRDLPAPLTPADCDLRDFRNMPLEVDRLRDSDLASEQTPEENWAAVQLWAAAWHQVPAGSIPNVENTIAKWAGYMARGRVDDQWPQVREGAMRGFVLCSDGRFYHTVVAEKAREAWMSKLQHAYDKLCERTRKANRVRVEKGAPAVECLSIEWWLSAGRPPQFPAEAPPLSGGNPPPSGGKTPHLPPERPPRSAGKPAPGAGIPAESHPPSAGSPAPAAPPKTPRRAHAPAPAPSGGQNGQFPPEDPPPSAGNPPLLPPESSEIPPENALKGIEGKGSKYRIPTPPTPSTLASPTVEPGAEERDTAPGNAHVEEVRGTRAPSTVTHATAVVVAMRAEGVAKVNASDPRVLALLARGADIAHFASAAKEAIERKAGDPFAYALRIVETQLDQAAAMAKTTQNGAQAPSPRRGEQQAAVMDALAGRNTERSANADRQQGAIDVESRVVEGH